MAFWTIIIHSTFLLKRLKATVFNKEFYEESLGISVIVLRDLSHNSLSSAPDLTGVNSSTYMWVHKVFTRDSDLFLPFSA